MIFFYGVMTKTKNGEKKLLAGFYDRQFFYYYYILRVFRPIMSFRPINWLSSTVSIRAKSGSCAEKMFFFFFTLLRS